MAAGDAREHRVDLAAGHELGFLHRAQVLGKLGRVHREVCRDQNEPFSPRLCCSGHEPAAKATVHRVVDDPDFRKAPCKRFSDLTCAISAGIVHDQDLVGNTQMG